jgi:hypothetical protein
MRFRTFIPSIALFVVASVASAQGAQEMLQGAGKPLTLNPDGLTGNFRAAQIKSTTAGSNGLMDMLMNPMMMIMGALGSMGGESKDAPPTALLTALDLSWTTGETQSFFGQTYLVIYKLDFDPSKMATAPKDLSTLLLRLQYMRTDTIASVTPRPDITPADFMKMLKTPLPKSSESTQPTAPPPPK